MSKIKVNLASGVALEKPLVTCFKGTNGNYIVLDNESNGSMGLPIIIISRLNGTSLEKIIDPNEWGAVKDNLKTIIGGTALPYLAVPETVTAPDDFFTQLTLPVASFDLLKNVYVAPADETSADAAAPVEPVAPVAPTPAEPVVPVAPTPEPVVAPAEVTLAPIPEVPVAPTTEVPITPVTPEPAPITPPVIEPPVVNNVGPVAPVTASPVTPEPVAPVVAPVAPEVTAPQVEAPAVTPEVPVAPTPVAEPSASAPAVELPEAQAPSTASNVDIETLKETFMKSCENMFDALIKKFNIK